MGIIMIVVFWVVPSFIVAAVAHKRGYSFWAYLLHCYLPSPFIALITLHVASTENKHRVPEMV